VLDELIRLGVAKEDGGVAELLSNEFVPRKDKAQFLSLGADNAQDHLNAIVSNLTEAENGNVFLEQAMWAEGFGAAACGEIQDIARECWNQTKARLRPKILQAAETSDDPHPYRVRLGFYAYFEPQTAEPENRK
jgi:hypothetical protein